MEIGKRSVGRDGRHALTRHPLSEFPPGVPNRPNAEAGAVRHPIWSSYFTSSPGVDVMVVRPFRRRRCGTSVRLVILAAIGITSALPHMLAAQHAASPTPASHTVKQGDTLWDLAKTYLGDAFLWPEIYRLNTRIIDDPHWIYPGEVLKLPGETTRVAAAPAVLSPAHTAATPPVATPTPVAPPTSAAADTATRQAKPSSIRVGEYVAAPWADQRKGPRGSGYIMQSADLPGIASADQSRLGLFDRVLISPPVGEVASEHQLYLAYRLGPFIEDFGQIIIPTGVIQATRPAHSGEATAGRVVKMFGAVLENQRLIVLDSGAALMRGTAIPVSNGRAGKVRWINNQPVLPSLQNYVVVDIPKGSVNTGDQVELYQPRQQPTDGRALAIPEVFIANAQVLRVTAYGATVLITGQQQPKIEEGTAARVVAKIP